MLAGLKIISENIGQLNFSIHSFIEGGWKGPQKLKITLTRDYSDSYVRNFPS